MKGRTRYITVTAMLTALTVVLLYISSLIPSGRIGMSAIAGLIAAAAVIEFGISAGAACFVSSSVIALVILPQKSGAILYLMFFGYYPILKSLFERQKKRAVEWTLKIVLLNAALTASYLLWRYGFLPDITIGAGQIILIYIFANIGFIIYDIGFSRLAHYYTTRIYKKR